MRAAGLPIFKILNFWTFFFKRVFKNYTSKASAVKIFLLRPWVQTCQDVNTNGQKHGHPLFYYFSALLHILYLCKHWNMRTYQKKWRKNIRNKLFVKFHRILSFFTWWHSLKRTRRNHKKMVEDREIKNMENSQVKKRDLIEQTTKDDMNVH